MEYIFGTDPSRHAVIIEKDGDDLPEKEGAVITIGGLLDASRDFGAEGLNLRQLDGLAGYWREVTIFLPASPEGADTAMYIAQRLRDGGFCGEIDIYGPLWWLVESRFYLMEVKWTLGRTIRQADQVQPLLRAVRELVGQWEARWPRSSPAGWRSPANWI